MKLWIFLTFIVNFSVSKPSFILSGPKIFQKGSDETVCLTLYNSTSTGNATLSLKLSPTASKDYHFVLDSSDCIVLSIPDAPSEGEGLLSFRALLDDGVELTGEKEIQFRERSVITLIQTDKPWYKPGQLVRFRVLSLDYHLLPIVGEFTQIQVEDPTGVVIELWKNVSTVQGLVQLELQLSAEPVQGSWKIKASRGTEILEKDFSVKEFELPRFEVQLKAPPKVSRQQTELDVEICTRYTYGQPVQMNYTITAVTDYAYSNIWDKDWANLASNPKFPEPGTDAKILKLEGKGLGCVKRTLNITDWMPSYGKIGLIAVATEDGTGISFNATADIGIEYSSSSFIFPDQSTFKIGIPVIGVVKFETTGRKSVENTTVNICLKEELHQPPYDKPTEFCQDFQVDENGHVPYSFLPIAINVTSLTITATEKISGTAGSAYLKQVFSASGNAIALVQPKSPGKCGENLSLPLLFTGSDGDNLTLHWQVVSRGDIGAQGNVILSYDKADPANVQLINNLMANAENDTVVSTANGGIESLRSHTLSYIVTDKDGPKLNVIAYATRPDGEVLTAVTTVDVESCFPNKVEMRWSDSKKKPGEKLKLLISGHSQSFCGISVVDKSVTLLQPENQLRESTVFQGLSDFVINSYSGPRQVTRDQLYCSQKLGKKEKRSVWNRYWYRPRYETRHIDPIAAFDDAGLFVMSDLEVESRPCVENEQQDYERFPEIQFFARPMFAAQEMIPDMLGANIQMKGPTTVGLILSPQAISEEYESPEELTSAVEVRSYFPETWLWDSFTLRDDGLHEESVEAPHTITNWVGRAICVSTEAGFGMSPSVELEVFQLFFVELNLPFSVKRGETLVLKVSTFNYAKHALPIAVKMPSSIQFDIISGNSGLTKCVQPQTKAVYTFKIKPNVLGDVNVTVEAFIDELFESECGPEVLPSARDTVVKPLLVIPEGLPVEKTFSSMICPKDFDEDKVTVWNITLPSNTIEGSARGWVTIIGDLMGPAVTGLSSLVRMPTGCGEQNMVIFTPIVYVLQYLESTKQGDPKLVEKAVGYLKTGYQRELTYRHDDGSYSAFGKSDSSGSMWLTAFVVRSFAGAKRFISIDEDDFVKSFKWILSKQLENGCFPSIGKVLHSDLKGGISDDASPIGLSAFVVASLMEAQVNETSKAIRNSLNCLKSETNQTTYVMALSTYVLAKAQDNAAAISRMETLLKGAKQENGLLWWEQGDSKSLWVEITAYNIMSLTLLSTNNDYKVKARSAVRWLAKQRNGNGGFFSTQDTVVGLQALALYSSSVPQSKVDMVVTVVAAEFEQAINIKEDRKLVQRQYTLPVLPTSVEVDAAGEGCILAQAVLRYNIPIEKEKESFNITVDISNDLEMSGCVKFVEENEISNMAVVDIEILSGHAPTKESISNLKSDVSNGIKRTEVTDGHIYLYYDELNSKGRCFKFELEEQFEVADLKPASVVVYDYYSTQKRGTFEMQPPSQVELP